MRIQQFNELLKIIDKQSLLPGYSYEQNDKYNITKSGSDYLLKVNSVSRKHGTKQKINYEIYKLIRLFKRETVDLKIGYDEYTLVENTGFQISVDNDGEFNWYTAVGFALG